MTDTGRVLYSDSALLFWFWRTSNLLHLLYFLFVFQSLGDAHSFLSCSLSPGSSAFLWLTSGPILSVPSFEYLVASDLSFLVSYLFLIFSPLKITPHSSKRNLYVFRHGNYPAACSWFSSSLIWISHSAWTPKQVPLLSDLFLEVMCCIIMFQSIMDPIYNGVT